MKPRRGDVYWVILDPAIGSERLRRREGRALGDQLRSIDKARLGKWIARLDAQELRDVDAVLRTTIDL